MSIPMIIRAMQILVIKNHPNNVELLKMFCFSLIGFIFYIFEIGYFVGRWNNLFCEILVLAELMDFFIEFTPVFNFIVACFWNVDQGGRTDVQISVGVASLENSVFNGIISFLET